MLEKIISNQIEKLKKMDPNNILDYKKIENYLMKGLKEVLVSSFDENSALSKDKIDVTLINKIESRGHLLGQSGKTMIDGFNKFREKKGMETIYNPDKIKNKDLLEFYKYSLDNYVLRFGDSAKQLLETYLFKKGLIKIEETSAYKKLQGKD